MNILSNLKWVNSFIHCSKIAEGGSMEKHVEGNNKSTYLYIPIQTKKLPTILKNGEQV